MTNAAKEITPSTVSVEAKQDGQTHDPWAWVEPTVWTKRMLQALVNGVKGGKWFSLMDKVYALPNLEASWKRVKRNKGAAGVDGQSVEQFAMQAESSLKWLHKELREGSYEPLSVKRHWIPKPGTNQRRPLGIPAVRDRVVQGAVRNVLEPIFEKKFVEQRQRTRKPSLAKCLLCQTQAVHDDHSPSAGCSVPIGTTDWRAGCGKSARPVRREGRPGTIRPSLPLFEVRFRSPDPIRPYWIQIGSRTTPTEEKPTCK